MLDRSITNMGKVIPHNRVLTLSSNKGLAHTCPILQI
jgi:hypothetical protein